MRTTLATLCALLVLGGCERRADRETAADLDRSASDTMSPNMAAGDTAAAAGTALDWQPAAFLPPGARAAVVEGDPTKAGFFRIQVEMPAGFEVRPHWHPMSEQVSVLEGSIMLGQGKEWADDKMKPLAVGEKANVAAKQPHYLRAKDRTVLEVRSEGPFEITYVNPADDPRKKAIP